MDASPTTLMTVDLLYLDGRALSPMYPSTIIVRLLSEQINEIWIARGFIFGIIVRGNYSTEIYVFSLFLSLCRY